MIVIRCDASPRLGMGHLMRCRSLASAFVEQGRRCILAGPPRDFAIAGDEAIFDDWITMPFQSPPAADAAALAALMSARSAKLAIVDDYRVDEAYQKVLREAGIHWLQFNDGPRMPLWADFALNPSPEATVSAYRQVVCAPETKLLIGPKFAMLRREFTAPAAPLPPPNARRILVTFGGGDDRGAVLKTLQTLLPALPDAFRFVVVSGAHNPRNTEIAAWIEAHGSGRAQLHVNPPEVASLFSGCSLAVMAGGGTTYEANFCRLPMLLIAIADNQVAHSKAWQAVGAARYLGRLENLTPDVLVSQMRAALDTQAGAKRLVDGHGRTRVAKLMLERVAA